MPGSRAGRSQSAAAPERSHGSRRPIGAWLVVLAVDENGDTSSTASGFDIAPAVAHHETVGEREVGVTRRRLEQCRRRLPAPAIIGIVMPAHADLVYRQFGAEPRMHAVDDLAALRPAGDIRLIGHYHQAEACIVQAGQGVRHGREDFERLFGCRRIRPLPLRTIARLITPSRSRKTARGEPRSIPISCAAALSAGCETQQVPHDRLERLDVRRDRRRGSPSAR